MREFIRIRGARTHNLRAVDLDVPRGKFVVFTGVSGSGKSSLVFDTLFAEGQRRFMECLSPFARSTIDELERPDVDTIDGLPPTMAVAQTGLERSHNPRSTVATLTEIHDYLRLLYARAGEPTCWRCGAVLGTDSREEIVASIQALPEGDRLVILAPLVHGKRGDHRDTFALIRREGFVRARVDGELVLVDPLPELDPDQAHDVEMVVDRQIVRSELSGRLMESIDAALHFGQGSVILARPEGAGWQDNVFHTRLACSDCGIVYRELEPRIFSFNSPYGACPHCQGLGIVQEFSERKSVPDKGKSLLDGALAPFQTPSAPVAEGFRKELEVWAGRRDFLSTPYRDLADDLRRELWEGSAHFIGVRDRLKEGAQSTLAAAQEWASAYLDDLPCPDCQGTRLAPEGRSVRVGGRTLPNLLACTIDEALAWSRQVEVSPKRAIVAEKILAELRERLQFLADVGVGYVELDRPVHTLSGGEAQRIRLASCVGSDLRGICYILDEPSVGLHPRDTHRLLETLTRLRDRGNSVLVVEHDPETMQRADWVVDLGPAAGRQGGEVVAEGTLDAIRTSASLTADYLAGRRTIARKTLPEPSTTDAWLTLEGVHWHNLRDVTLRVPLGRLVAVTGVSGSGKSSLVVDMLVPTLRSALGGSATVPGSYRTLTGWETLGQILFVDQQPIGRTPRSCPATHAGLLDLIRNVFAKSREARVRGFRAGRFSFNNREGQCPACEGLGARRVELGFMPDQFVRCPTCRGKRYNRTTRQVRFKGKSIDEVLALTIDEAAEFFRDHPRLSQSLDTLRDVGLGYLELGQWGTTLSGGEAQRLKLAGELVRARSERVLYVLDEPTTGLHLHDVAQLLSVLSALVDQGHSVLIIEHHLDMIAQSDWIVDLGPEGGTAGGRIVAEGTPSRLAKAASAPTGEALRAYFAGSSR